MGELRRGGVPRRRIPPGQARVSGIMGIRILIVEDEVELADFIVRGLREEGFGVERAADGKQAWEALQVGTWDLVVLDWWLPGEDGLAVLRRYRQAGGAAPVLFLTARDAVADRVRGLDGGADDYLSKPFAFDELLARIRALLRRRNRVPELTLSHGDVSIDLATHRACRAGQALDLTAKESALLTFFCAILARYSRGRGSTTTFGTRTSTACPTRWRST